MEIVMNGANRGNEWLWEYEMGKSWLWRFYLNLKKTKKIFFKVDKLTEIELNLIQIF